ncbi:MAG: ankyrin repeat domain-containing protein [Rhodobacteraceae bacterium]|nr:ankyrin repeat domain-containing protein [Paracoccaceae bacterium]
MLRWKYCGAGLITALVSGLLFCGGLLAAAAAQDVDCRGWTKKAWWFEDGGRQRNITAQEVLTCLRNHNGHLPQAVLYRVTYRTVLEDEKATLTRALLEAGLDSNGFSWKLPLLFGWAGTGWGGRSSRFARRSNAANDAQLKALLEAGADPNLTIARGQEWTALHVASYVGRPGVVSLLLKHNADATAVTTQRRWTPLHGLVWSGGRNLADTTETARILLDAGVDPAAAAKDASGRTAWDIIQKRHGEQLQKMLDAGEVPPETRQILAHLHTAAKR